MQEEDAERLYQRGGDLFLGENGVKEDLVEAAKFFRNKGKTQ